MTDEIAELKKEIYELRLRVQALERAVPPKALKWTKDEDNYLVRLATINSLSKEDVRLRNTKYYAIIVGHQAHYERTERAITMRLDKVWFS